MKNFFLITVGFILLASCGGSTTLTMKPVTLKDFTFDGTPNDRDNVGYIFAVDKSNIPIPVTTLDLSPTVGHIVIPSSNSQKNVTYGGILSFMGLSNLDLTADLTINNNTKLDMIFALDNPTYSTSDLVRLDTQLEKSKPIIIKALTDNHLENAKIYVILETIKSKKLTYVFDKTKIDTVKLNANFKKIISLTPKANWNNHDSSSLSYNTETELSVFYKLFKISVLPGAVQIDIKRGSQVSDNEMIFAAPQTR
jgi:hypothetical protein